MVTLGSPNRFSLLVLALGGGLLHSGLRLPIGSPWFFRLVLPLGSPSWSGFAGSRAKVADCLSLVPQLVLRFFWFARFWAEVANGFFLVLSTSSQSSLSLSVGVYRIMG